ncbi:MAG: hypothetical protein Q9219_007621 [cf. Caloplaca sp. 3 TL-2023]
MLPSVADMAIVLGTSLSVQPFASLPGFCREGVPRLLVNLESAGGLGSRADDVLLLGDCDAGVRELANALGWLTELEALFETYNPAHPIQQRANPQNLHDDDIENELAKITKEVDRTLRISSEHAAASAENPEMPSLRLSSIDGAIAQEELSQAIVAPPLAQQNYSGREQFMSRKSSSEEEETGKQDNHSTGH